ncbi:hypothetical protein IFM89_022792 [Coptis chinensis]|uniref:Zinc finger PHD-type domain-containing protein n=1 Tax=Coptis chinensis TaxID=261450 RepID=A0A835I6D9_9MAGN|nr:hypothetical protein IFM89_022792 [Coptis chinensis]
MAGKVEQSVKNYFFVDDKDEAISFSVLPMIWSENEVSTNVYLHGIKDDGGPGRISHRVIAWKLDFSRDLPGISVLSVDNNWINLQNPRRSFVDTIRTILITIHCLHILKKHPSTSQTSLWSHLQKNFSEYEVKPSEIDLLDHLPLICAAVKQDETLAKTTFMLAFFEDPKKRKVFDEQDIRHHLVAKKHKFLSEDNGESIEETMATIADESVEGRDLFDSVCALCDNGGELLCCEGRCLRCFHATVDTGAQAGCKSLGLSEAQIQAMQEFLCMNCKYNQHQCFSCGKLGSSDRSNNAEVFLCASANCGHFYHPRCVAKLLHPISELSAEDLQKRIIAGESFTCTVHKCSICKEEENTNVRDLQFAICRRCPKVFHRKCLPREISFETIASVGIVPQRAWGKLLPDRILIYCLKHKIDHSTLMPVGDHIKFPDAHEKKKLCSSYLQPGRNGSRPIIQTKQTQGKSDSKMNSQVIDASRLHLKDRVKYNSKKVDKLLVLDEADALLREGRLKQVVNKKQGVLSKSKKTLIDVPVGENLSSSPPSGDIELKTRLVDLVKKKSSSKTSKILADGHKAASSQRNTLDSTINKTISPRKLEGSVNAFQVSDALVKKKICSQYLQPCQEKILAKDISAHSRNYPKRDPANKLKQVDKMPSAIRDQISTKVHMKHKGKKDEPGPNTHQSLTPTKRTYKENFDSKMNSQILNASRLQLKDRNKYTYKKVDNLKIADKLHWYVQNGDTTVAEQPTVNPWEVGPKVLGSIPTFTGERGIEF